MNLFIKISRLLTTPVFALLLIGANGYGQVLKKPEIQFSHPCASASFNLYHVDFKWDPPLVANDNQFILELSDGSGSFQNPEVLSTVSDKNTTFSFQFEFSFPTDTYGTGYKVRVRSTSPQLTSPESDVFPAYYLAVTDALILNNYQGNSAVCSGSQAHLEVTNYPNEIAYRWYKNGTFIPEETNYFIDTDVPGIYYVELDYGSTCSGTTISNAVQVSVVQPLGVGILGADQIELCSNDTSPYFLEASIDDNTLSYQWFKDNVAVSSIGYYPTFDVNSVTSSAGDWYVEVTQPSGCSEQSNTVQIVNTTATVNITSTSLVILPNDSVTLNLTTNVTSPTISWYKDDVLVADENKTSLVVQNAGSYYAKVVDDKGCNEIQSNIIKVNEPVSFAITIDYTNAYANCSDTTTHLGVSLIIATLTDGQTLDVTTDLVNKFTWQWVKDGENIVNANNSTLSISKAQDNGVYTVKGQLSDFSETSNSLTVQLTITEDIVLSYTGQISCDGSTSVNIKSSVTSTDYDYYWYLNNTLVDAGTQSTLNVNESGEYYLKVLAYGCEKESNKIVINPIDESVVELDIDGDISITEGSSQTVTASGANSYQWYKQGDTDPISVASSVLISEEGDYTLVAYVNGCEVVKTFSVFYIVSNIVPNVITANFDGINDQWILPNSYAFKNNVTVVVQTDQGEILLNTNNYQNTWPVDPLKIKRLKPIFYYKIIKDGNVLKKGTITIIY